MLARGAARWLAGELERASERVSECLPFCRNARRTLVARPSHARTERPDGGGALPPESAPEEHPTDETDALQRRPSAGPAPAQRRAQSVEAEAEAQATHPPTHCGRFAIRLLHCEPGAKVPLCPPLLAPLQQQQQLGGMMTAEQNSGCCLGADAGQQTEYRRRKQTVVTVGLDRVVRPSPARALGFCSAGMFDAVRSCEFPGGRAVRTARRSAQL